jgi:hypothetical protein
VAVSLLLDTNVTGAGTLPNETVDVLVNPLPEIVTAVPPAVGPAAGLTSMTDGGGW